MTAKHLDTDVNREGPPGVHLGALTRLDVLRAGLGAGVALAAGPLLAACGGGDEAAGPATVGGAATTEDISGTISFFSWEGYDLLNETADWREQNGVEIKSTYVSGHADIQAKFSTGGGKGVYNLSTYNAGYGPGYQKLGLLSPLDLSKIPNWENAYPFFRESATSEKWWNFDGEQWGLPWTWGASGINYDASKIDAPVKAVDLMSPSFKDKFAVMDDMSASIHMGALITGVFRDDSLYTKEQLDEIIEVWKELKKNARSIAPSYGDLAEQFASGEIVAAMPGWSAVNVFAADKGKTTIMHTIPEEGGHAYADAWFIPPDSDDVDTVYAFINESLTPEVQAEQAKSLAAGVVIPDAVPMLDPGVAALYPYEELEALFEKAQLIAVPFDPPEGYVSFADWLDAWTAFKAA
jgi:spermidine/putrescine transport system substrate-binding protein